MFRIKFFCLILCLSVGLINGSNIKQKIADDLNLFTSEFSEIVFKSTRGNEVCSAISTAMMLLMISHGAKGSTANQLKSILHVDVNQPLTSHIKTLLESSEGSSNHDYKLATKIYVSKNYNIDNFYKFTLSSIYNSEIEAVNFKSKQSVANKINSWFADQTEDEIKKTISKNVVDPETKLTLTSSFYFRGLWKKKFNLGKSDYFFSESGSKKLVKMMMREGCIDYRVLKDIPASIVKLPFDSVGRMEELSLFIVLPNLGNRLSDIDLKKVIINEIFSTQTSGQRVSLTLPKFRIKEPVNIKEHLVHLGLKNLFNNYADLSGITRIPNKERFFINSIYQNFFLDVNEKGLEVESDTVCSFPDELSNRSKVTELKINRPFYAILANKFIISFIARITDI